MSDAKPQTTIESPAEPRADLGPQRGPASVGRIEAQVKHARREWPLNFPHLACCKKCGRPFTSGNDDAGGGVCDGCTPAQPSPPQPKATLGLEDKPGWYECRTGAGILYSRRVFYWDGINLAQQPPGNHRMMHSPADYTDFIPLIPATELHTLESQLAEAKTRIAVLEKADAVWQQADRENLETIIRQRDELAKLRQQVEWRDDDRFPAGDRADKVAELEKSIAEVKSMLHPEEKSWHRLVDGVRVTMKAYWKYKERVGALESELAEARAELERIDTVVGGPRAQIDICDRIAYLREAAEGKE